MFVGDDCSLQRTPGSEGTAYQSLNVTIFNPRNSRAFPEHDLPAPMKVGHKLFVLSPARPGSEPRLLLDAGRGAIGSPSVTFDGQSILVSMAYGDEPFYRIYRVPADGGPPQRLTDGPFHDIDPVELPDGRIAFTSTRIGRFEEYHNPPSRSLWVMNPDGSNLRPLTHTIIFDNEPEVLADGRIVFIRSDNFFDRGKVETLAARGPSGRHRGLHRVRTGQRAGVRRPAAGLSVRQSGAVARRPAGVSVGAGHYRRPARLPRGKPAAFLRGGGRRGGLARRAAAVYHRGGHPERDRAGQGKEDDPGIPVRENRSARP